MSEAASRDNDRPPNRCAPENGRRITYFPDQIPDFVESALEHLYNHRFASLAHYRVYGGCENTSTYVVHGGTEVVALFLFKRIAGTVYVSNEGIRIGKQDLSEFSEFIFSHFRAVRKIVFRAIELDEFRLEYPCHRVVLAENTVATLPATQEEYKGRLGKSTRAYLNRYLNKLKREIPDFQFVTIERENILDDHIVGLVEMSQARMAIKKKKTRHNENNTRLLIRYAKQCGVIDAIMIDGKICACILSIQTGDSYFMEMVSHDPSYDDYRLGTLCCYMAICECIRRGARKYYFMWGRYEYKYRLLGEKQDLANLIVYRSTSAYALDIYRIVGDMTKHHLRRFILWAHSVRPEEGAAAWLAVNGLHAWLWMRRLVGMRLKS